MDNLHTSFLMGFECAKSGTYQFEAIGFETFTKNGPVFLEDLETGKLTDLRSNPEYSFQHVQGNPANRFRLYFGSLQNIPEINSDILNCYTSGKTIFVKSASDLITFDMFDLSGSQILSTMLHGSGNHEIKTNAKPGCYLVRFGNTYSFKIGKVFIEP